jgi:hypothetical protein
MVGIVAIPSCADGVADACSMSIFIDWVNNREREIANWAEICRIESNMPSLVTFLHQAYVYEERIGVSVRDTLYAQSQRHTLQFNQALLFYLRSMLRCCGEALLHIARL